jgi:hypothetical protein
MKSGRVEFFLKYLKIQLFYVIIVDNVQSTKTLQPDLLCDLQQITKIFDLRFIGSNK